MNLPPRPFWLAQALATEAASAGAALEGRIEADVCIVGGGFTGLWTAIQLKQQRPDLRVVIVERDICGAGASGRNGGCLLTLATKYFTLRKLFGAIEAARIVRASERAVGEITSFCLRHGIDAELRLDGTLYTASNAAQLDSLRPVLDELQRQGLSSWQEWPLDQVQAHAGSARHQQGFFSPVAGSLQPGKLVRGLARVAQQLGVTIYPQTPMLDLEQGALPVVRTPHGQVHAQQVVLALNAWMPQMFRQFSRSVVLVSSDMLITQPCPEQLAELGLGHGSAVLDSRTFVNYYRSTVDGRLMLGKGGNSFAFANRMHAGFDQPSRWQGLLEEQLHSFFPSLREVPVASTWTGASDRTVSGLPFFGQLNGHPRIHYGLGYSGNGVGPSYLGGEILSALVLGQDNVWARSPLVRGPLGQFAPEPLRYLGVHLVRDAIRRQERAEDANRQPRWLDQRLARLAQAAGKADKG